MISLLVFAAVVGHNPPAYSLTAERVHALVPPAQQAAWLDYLDRSARRMAEDRAWVAAELRASGRADDLIPAEGRSMRVISMDHPADWYASAEARRLADNLITFQTPNGGWSKNLSYQEPRAPGERFMADNISHYLTPGDYDTPQWREWNYFSTLDNDATSHEMRFLLRMAAAMPAARAADAQRYRDAYLRGIGYLLAAQYPNGGFPQVYPLEGGYHDAITINDDAATQAIEVLFDAGRPDGPAFIPAGLRARCASAAARGIACLLSCQIVSHGVRTVWCQQHDAITLEPVSGRNFEPPAACSDESSNVLLFLMDIPHPSPEVVAAVRAGVAWLRKTAVYGKAYRRTRGDAHLVDAPGAGPIWARYYDVATDRPVFGDRDKTIHDEVGELSQERRRGYNWWPSGPRESLDKFASWNRSVN